MATSRTNGGAAAGNALAAAALAERGWAVFPLAGKVPRTVHGLKDASTKRSRVAEWWRRWPEAGIGVRTRP